MYFTHVQIYFPNYPNNIDCNHLREFVLTHVILAPGARGRGGPSSGPWRHFRGIRVIREIVPNRTNYMCFYSKRDSGDTPVWCCVTLRVAISCHLRELVWTHVILAPGACGREGQSGGSGTILSGSAGSGDGFIFARFRHEKQCKWNLSRSRALFFSTFSYPSHLKHLVLRAFLEDCLPELFSKLTVLAETSMKFF